MIKNEFRGLLAVLFILLGHWSVGAQISLTCPPDSVLCLTTSCDTSYVLTTPTAQTNCGVPDLAFSYAINGSSFAELPPAGILLTDLAPNVYDITILVSDICGNETSCDYALTIIDCQAPDPNCAPFEVVFLDETGQLDLLASDLVPNPTDNCPENLTVSFSSDPNDQMRSFFCRDAAEPQLMTVFVTDEAGNQTSCLVPVFVEDPFASCRELSGFITTEWGEALAGALIEIKGTEEWTIRTEADGFYSILLPEGGSYLLRPCADGNWADGVTNSDVQLLQNYLADATPLSPYVLLSADLDNNSQVNFLDLLTIQQLSSGAPNIIPANRSWRFFQAGFTFPNPANPFATLAPESYTINNLDQAQLNLDFIGVKIGNVDGPASGPITDLSTLDCSPSGAGKCGGTVFWDQNANCIPEFSEAGQEKWLVQVSNALDTFYQLTGPDGTFQFNLSPGDYTVEVFVPNAAWSLCQNAYPVTITPDGITYLSIGGQTNTICSWPEVDLTTGPLRVCDSVQIALRYANRGTEGMEDAFIQVVLDPDLLLLSASSPFIVQSDTLVFPLGFLSPGETGQIWIDGFLDCDALLGRTHCSEARIFPQNTCLPAGPDYDGSVIEVGFDCQLDSLEFQIRNTGSPMTFAADWIVIEDEMIMRTGGVQLTSNQVATVRVPANGSTYRIEVDQHPDFPGTSFPSTVVEGCGQNPSGGISTGFVTQFPEDDELPDVAVSCTQNTDGSPIALKEGYPFGYQDPHYITVDRELEYQLNFTDSTYSLPSLLVIDTLANALDILKFQALAASHPYEFTILPNGALAFFLQEEAGEARRDWFVRFGTYPKPDTPDGTIIENQGTFYPSTGSSSTTNQTFHTIGSDFIEIIPDTSTALIPANWFQVRPNLVTESAIGYLYRFEEANKEFLLYDARGQLVIEINSHAATFEIPVNNLPAGAYYYRLFVDKENMLQGKIIIQ